MVRLLRRFPSNDGDGGTVTNRIRVTKTSILSVFAATGVGLAAATASPSASAQGVTQLEGITIYSANRTPTDAAKVGSSVEVLTEKDLEARSQTFVKDYLETLPGVSFVQSGPAGTTSQLSIRGATGQYVKVLVDGMDISDPSGTRNQVAFEHLLVGDVSRIEVLKGSQSTLYGGDAIGGVISIETKAATKLGFSQSGGVEGGQYNSFRGAYNAGYATADGSNISFTVQGVDTDGFSAASAGTEDDGYQNLTLSGRGEYMLSPSMKLFFAARTLEADSEFDNAYNNIGVWPNNLSILIDSPASSTTEQHAGRVGMEFSLLNGAFQNTLAIQGMQVKRDIFLDDVRTNWYDGERVKGEYKGVLTFNDRLSLLAGADWERTAAETSNHGNHLEADVGGVFAQLMMEPIDGLVLSGGGRIDEHSTFGQYDTYRLTAAYLLAATQTKFRGSVGTGFRAPALDELFGDYGFGVYGNPDLEPEESESWDVGVDQEFLSGKLRLGATYFELDTDNFIAFIGACTIAQPCLQNLPGVTHRSGVELTGTAVITSGIVLTASYTLVDTEDPDGETLIRVPRHTFVAGVDWQPTEKVELNVTAKYVADMLDNTFDSRGIIEADDYLLVSAKASYEFTPGWKAYVRGENLLDEDYEALVGYGTAGLSVFGGVTMALPTN